MDNEDNTIRDALDAAFEQVESGAPAVDAPEIASGRTRDEGGRFAKNDVQDAPIISETPAKAEPVAQAAPAAPGAADQAAQAAASGAKAPGSWKPEAAAIWTKIDSGQPVTQAELKVFRAEAERREGDFHRGVEGWKQHASVGKAYESALAPYQETLKTLGVDGVTAVTELMKADHVLRHAPESVKLQKLIDLANVYKIDLSKQFSPEVARYEQELYQTREQLNSLKNQTEASAYASLNSDIERFAQSPGHEHFEAVRPHMAALLTGGLAKDLEDAYQQAVFANPQTRAPLLEQRNAKAADDQRRQRALAASGSVRGSSPASGSSGIAAPTSVRDAITAAFDEHS